MQIGPFESDESIIDLIKKGDDAPWLQLYRSILPVITNFIKQNHGNEQDAKDIFQNALIVFRENILTGRLVLTSSIKTYLFEVCRRMWLKEIRTKKYRKEMLVNQDKEILQPEDSSEEEEIAFSERQIRAQKCLEQMSDTCRTILHLFFTDSRSMEYIASKSGMANADVAKSAKSKCMRKLRDCVKSNNLEGMAS